MKHELQIQMIDGTKHTLDLSPLIGKQIPLGTKANNPEEGIINSFGLKPINLLKPTAEMIDIRDIAHGLAHICRFGGQSSEFYSVAQHCVLVAWLSPMDMHLPALLHDAAEAYLGDVVSPLKKLLGQTYHNLEYNFQLAIASKFDIYDWFACQTVIKPFDKQALKLEYDYLFMGDRSGALVRAFNTEQTCWTPQVAEEMFLTHFELYQMS